MDRWTLLIFISLNLALVTLTSWILKENIHAYIKRLERQVIGIVGLLIISYILLRFIRNCILIYHDYFRG